MAIAQSPSAPSTAAGIIVPLWPDGKMPGHGAALPESQTPLQPKPGSVLRITNVSQPTLDIFKVPGATGPVPAVIICPGGGYGILAYNLEGTEIAAWLNSLGITAIVLKYRVPDNRDGAFQDIQRAVRLVRSHATEWGIQPDKLGAIGFSAGGHLVARLSTNFDQPAYPAIDSADKLSCRPDFVLLAYPGYLNVKGKLAPEIPLSPAMPPTLIVVAEDDLHHFIDSKTYDAALTASNISHEYIHYQTGGHGFGLRSHLEAKAWPTQAAGWLRKSGILPAK